jgi:hypothetical protein
MIARLPGQGDTYEGGSRIYKSLCRGGGGTELKVTKFVLGFEIKWQASSKREIGVS